MPESEEEQRDAIRVHAKAITGRRQEMYLKGRLGIVIDSTARDVKGVLKQKKLLQNLGYETAMVFVNTSLETALDRNRERERSIPDDIVKSNHGVVRTNMGKLQTAFGRQNFFIVDNDGDISTLDKNTTKVFPKISAWVKSFPDNLMAKAWKSALTMKPMKNTALAAEYEHPAEMERRLMEQAKKPKSKKLKFDNPLKGFPYNEDRVTDALKDKQDREKEQLKKKHDAEKDRDRLRQTRDKNRETQPTESVSPEVMKTKEKIYKDLKKKKKYFDKEYGDKSKEVMHGTAMNQAKKQHKVAEGRFSSELERQLKLEALNQSQRRAIGMRMKRLAKKIQRAKKKAAKRMAPNAKLLQRSQKQARLKLFKKMSGGKTPGQLPLGTRIALSKKLDKKKGKIAALAKKMMPKVKKAEMERLAAFRQNKNKNSKNPKVRDRGNIDS
tara:strand:- start:292 stop:1611 length:1320 start_codon:yes stop_codon:yes gene_type:complete